MDSLTKQQSRSQSSPSLYCTVKEVEEVKIVLRILPIFMSTIMLNCCLAQLSTFSVQQAAHHEHKDWLFKDSTSFSSSVFQFSLSWKTTKSEMGITHLQRIGTGLVLSIVAMAIAALVESKRKRVAMQTGLVNSKEPLPITFLWVALQYLFLGSADLFSLAGLMEFFFTEAPFSMRSLATALSWASLAMGYFLSSVLVSIVNRITGTFRHTPWLYGNNLNHYHLERFYWLMCILSGLNFLHYLFWAYRYKYRSSKHEEDTNSNNNMS
nr:protein NRT1/ PTR FAMILY 4.6-like [Ipomoea batatas]